MMVVDSSWVDKAWDLLRAGEYDESIAQCNKVIKKDMRCGEIWYTLGLAYHLKGSAIDDVREQVKAIKPLEWCSSS